jgi:hypothetical protein
VDLDAMQITVARQAKGKVEKARTKSGRARVVAIEPNLAPLLRALVVDKQPDEKILRMPAGSNHPAEQLRKDLLRAGCTREALHVDRDDPMRAPMRFHNLRDTCLTHMAVRRDPPQDVQWRAGHTTAAMTERYIANARYEAGPNSGEPLAPLPAELIAASGGDVIENVITTQPKRISQCGRPVTVEAPGIEPGSENSEATCVYVRVQSFESSRFALTDKLASGLVTCLISPQPR